MPTVSIYCSKEVNMYVVHVKVCHVIVKGAENFGKQYVTIKSKCTITSIPSVSSQIGQVSGLVSLNPFCAYEEKKNSVQLSQQTHPR